MGGRNLQTSGLGPLEAFYGPKQSHVRFCLSAHFCLLRCIEKVKTRSIRESIFSINFTANSSRMVGAMTLPPIPLRVHPPMTVKHTISKRLNITFSITATSGAYHRRAQTSHTSFERPDYRPISHSFASIRNVPLARTRAISPALAHPSSSGCPTLGTGSPIVGPRMHSCTCVSVIDLRSRRKSLETYQTFGVSTLFAGTLVNVGELNFHVCGWRSIMPRHAPGALLLGRHL